MTGQGCYELLLFSEALETEWLVSLQAKKEAFRSIETLFTTVSPMVKKSSLNYEK